MASTAHDAKMVRSSYSTPSCEESSQLLTSQKLALGLWGSLAAGGNEVAMEIAGSWEGVE